MGEPRHDDEPPHRSPAGRTRRRLRWLHLLLVALALLAASEVLWRWHSWPVRALLDGVPAQTPGVAP